MDDDNNFVFNEFLFDETGELLDCFLDEAALSEFLAPPAQKWSDVSSTSVKTKVTVDDAKNEQWDRAKDEIRFVLKNLKNILGLTDDSICEPHEIVMFILGPESRLGLLFQKELNLTSEEYTKFMVVFCIQAAYKQSSTQLFLSGSLLFDSLPMKKVEYNKIWETLSKKKEIK